jgi:hypothetical protein
MSLMSEMVPVMDAQRGAPGRLLAELATKDQHTPWRVYVRGLEAANQVRFVPAGEVLTAQRVYIDLLQPCKGPFRALRGQTAGSRNRYLAQDEVPAAVWHALIEHCACVDKESGAIASFIDLPCRRRAVEQESNERRAFAA